MHDFLFFESDNLFDLLVGAASRWNIGTTYIHEMHIGADVCVQL